MEEVEDIRRECGALLPSNALMEKPVVQLEIPPRWMLWRVYNPEKPWGVDPWERYYDKEYVGGVKDEGRDLQVQWDMKKKCYVCGGDAMNEEGFDEAASFPAFKPDRDLFGPPRRCRKQRGWYYVKRWSPATHAISVPPQDEYAPGADVPPELFNDIVKCFLEDSERDCKLGALRLVCRHWKRLCMETHFARQTLRSHEDVMERLVGLEKRCRWGWKAYPIWNLRLHLDVTRKPRGWLYIVQTKLISRLDRPPRYVDLEVTGPLPGGRRLTSVYLSSPCRLPWCPFILRNLWLKDLHFINLDDLVRVLRELPLLAYVRGSGITWDSAPDVCPRATSFIPAKRSSDDTWYIFNHCPHLGEMLACALSPSGTPPIAQPDANLLCALASTFTQASRSRSTRSYEVITMCSQTVYIELAPPQSRLQARTVQAILIKEFDRSSEDPSVAIAWEIVADSVEKLIARPNLILIFPSLQSAISFHQAVATPKMPRLVFQERLKYVLKDIQEETPEKRTWSLIEPDGDDGWRVLATEHFDRAAEWANHSLQYSESATRRMRRLAGLPGFQY